MARSKSGCIPILIIGVVLFLVAGVLAFMYIEGRRQSVGDRKQAARDRGEPTSLEELNTWYAEPPGEDATPLFLQAMAAVESLPRHHIGMLNDRTLPPLAIPLFPAENEPMSAEARAAVDEFLHSQADTRARIARAVALGGARFPVDFTDRTTDYLTHLSGMRQVVRLMLFDATANAWMDNPGAAVESLTLALGTLKAIENFPALIGQLTRAGGYRDSVETFTQIVSRTQLPPEQLTTLATAFRDAYSAESLRTAMLGERAFALSPGGPFDANILLYAFDWPRLLDVYDVLLESTEGTPRDVHLAIQQLNAPDSPANAPGFRHPYTRIIVPPLLRATESHVRTATQQNLVLLICQIERHRITSGEIPEDLVTANIEPANDPYTNTPLVYTQNETGYTVSASGHEDVALQVTR